MQFERRLTDAFGTEQTIVYITPDRRRSKRHVTPNEDLTFMVKTYSKLSRASGEDSWDAFFHLTNKFLGAIDKETQEHVYAFYEAAHRELVKIDETNYMDVTNKVSNHLAALLRKVNLPQLLLDFVASEDLMFPDLTDIGKRAHDREELTFRLPEYHILTAISLLCKLICPVWGDFIFRTPDMIDTIDKEARCLAIATVALEHPVFAPVVHKLEEFMDNMIGRFFNQQQKGHGGDSSYDLGFTLAYSGYSRDRFTQNVAGMLYVKKFAIYDPTPEVDPDGTIQARNIMTYVASGIKAVANAIAGALQNKSVTMVRRDPNESTVNEGDSTTHLENESHVSHVTADTPRLIQYGIIRIIEDMRTKNAYPTDLFESALAYYRKNQPQMNVYGRAILSVFIGRQLGGAGTLSHLTLETAIQLITLTQFHMARADLPIQLLHLMSAQSSPDPKKSMTAAVDQRIRMSYDSSTEYRNLLAIYPLSLGPYRSIRQQISDIITFVTEYDHTFNTAPALMEFIGDARVPNGDPLVYDDRIIRNICAFIADRATRSQLSPVA